MELYIVLPCPQEMFREQCVTPVEVWLRMDVEAALLIDRQIDELYSLLTDFTQNMCSMTFCGRMGTG